MTVLTVPIPPGTGVIAEATALTPSKSTSPTIRPSRSLIPTSTTTAPGLIIGAVISEAERDCKLAFKGSVPPAGCYVPAAIFRDVNASTPLWREEVFGPVIAVRRAASFEDAVAGAVESQYALTGAVYSRSPAHIEYAQRRFKVGNLYINRGCTGALVYRQPFGGFKLSGVGSKAGGPDYLLQFMEPRVITENTMRRGFTPESK